MIVRQRLANVLGTTEPPQRVAAAWGLGIGIAFTPLIGLHTGIALALAFLFRLNKLDVFLGTLVINPWTMVVYIPSATVLGSWITGSQLTFGEASAAMISEPLWRLAASYTRGLVVSWLVGGFLCSLLAGTLTYVSILRTVRWRRSRLTDTVPDGLTDSSPGRSGLSSSDLPPDSRAATTPGGSVPD
jgi:uncharacterized protein